MFYKFSDISQLCMKIKRYGVLVRETTLQSRENREIYISRSILSLVALESKHKNAEIQTLKTEMREMIQCTIK